MHLYHRKNVPLTRAAAVVRASGQNGRCRGSMRLSVIAVSFQIPVAPAVPSAEFVDLPHMRGASSGCLGPKRRLLFHPTDAIGGLSVNHGHDVRFVRARSWYGSTAGIKGSV